MFIHNLRTRFDVNEWHVMTSIFVQIDNHRTVMPTLLATCYITQHLHKPSMNRYNHRLSSCTTSYTRVNTRWGAHRRGHRKTWIISSVWWTKVTWCPKARIIAPCPLQNHILTRPTAEFLYFHLIHRFIPLKAKLREVLKQLLP